MRQWIGDGPEFGLDWGGRVWTLRVDADRPGLYAGAVGPLLGLEGLAEVGRWSPTALSGATLTGFERRFGRVEATYAPPDWGELTVRAAWAPGDDDAVDLEIQVAARSVGRLKAVEVKLLSALLESIPEAAEGGRVEARDDRSAGLNRDGREPEPGRLDVATPPCPFEPRRLVPPSDRFAGLSYTEMVHPEDVSRRIVVPPGEAALRYGLLGHDLERGVVLRGRLRGSWLPSPPDWAEVDRRFGEFLRGPLPLST